MGVKGMSTVNDVLIEMSNLSIQNSNSYVTTIESLANELLNAEHTVVLQYKKEQNSLVSVNEVHQIRSIVINGVLEEVLTSKKAIFNNHVINHKLYNNEVDNVLNIELKSMIVVPILDKLTHDSLGLIVVVNSTKSEHNFKRYDIRIVESLIPFSRISFENNLFIQNITGKEEENKDNILEYDDNLTVELAAKNLEIIKLKEELERKNHQLSQGISIKENLFTDEEENHPKPLSTPIYEVEIFKDRQNRLHEEISKNLEFMLNEISYINNSEHEIYHFIELIKNSLHDKGQMEHIEKNLRENDFLYKMTSDYYQSKKVVIEKHEVNVSDFFEDIVNLYSINISNSQLIFNVFINPNMPKSLKLDSDKLQTIIINMINNIYAFTNVNGAIELLVSYDYHKETLLCVVNGISTIKKGERFKSLFKKESIENSLGSQKAGLGLSISSNLTKILGGEIEISRRKEKNSFVLTLPAENFLTKELPDIKSNIDNLSIGILMSRENQLAYENFIRYMEAFGIDENKIFVAKSHSECADMELSHLFCFDNMLHKDMEIKAFNSFIILKRDLFKNYKEYLEIDTIHELYLNFHYGRKLKKLLFPDTLYEESTQTLIVEKRLSSKYKIGFLNKLFG